MPTQIRLVSPDEVIRAVSHKMTMAPAKPSATDITGTTPRVSWPTAVDMIRVITGMVAMMTPKTNTGSLDAR